MLIGALSLVMFVWLGTSMNFSRMSTFTGRSTIGIRKFEARAAHEARVRSCRGGRRPCARTG